MPRNTDKQQERRRGAWASAWSSTMFQLLPAGAILYLRWHMGVTGLPGVLLLVVALIDFGTIVPIWILLKQRLHEMEGGEEDAAAQY